MSREHVPMFRLGSVSPPRSPHLNSAGKHPGLAVILRWPLKLSSLSRPLKLCRALPGHQGSRWTEDASTGHSRTFCRSLHGRGTRSAEAPVSPRAPSPPSASPGPLFLGSLTSSLPQSCFHAPGRDPTAPPNFSFSLPSSILDSL